MTVHVGDNSGLIENVSNLYFSEGDSIADVIFGRGVFWRKVPSDKFRIIGSDLKTGIDFGHLPYEDNSFDHSVIDPPYARISNFLDMVDCYNMTGGMAIFFVSVRVKYMAVNRNAHILKLMI